MAEQASQQQQPAHEQAREHAAEATAVRAPSTSHHSDDSDDSDAPAHKPYIMSQELFDALTGKGFSANAAKKSIVAGCVDEATCTQWLTMHEGHAELDTPLADGVEVVVRAKRVLTDEERAAAVSALQVKIARKKAEAKAEAQRKELERIEFGRKAIEARAKVDAVRRELELKQVREQKAADAAARRRVKIQILADRYVRQGLSSADAWQAAAAEYDEAVNKERSAAAARLQANKSDGSNNNTNDAASTATTTPQQQQQQQQQPSWNLAALVDAHDGDAMSTQLQRIFAAPLCAHSDDNDNDDDDNDNDDRTATMARTCVAAMRAAPPAAADAAVATVRSILTRIRDDPFDAKLRSLKTSTKAFTQRLLPVPAAVQLLRLCNFDLHTDAESGAQTLVCATVVMRTLDTVLRLLDATDTTAHA